MHPADCCTSGRPPPFILARPPNAYSLQEPRHQLNPHLSADCAHANTLTNSQIVCVCVRACINIRKCISANTFIPHGHMGRCIKTQRHTLANSNTHTHIQGSLLIFSVCPPAHTHSGKCLHFPMQYEPISVCFIVEVKCSIFSSPAGSQFSPQVFLYMLKRLCASVFRVSRAFCSSMLANLAIAFVCQC